MQGYMAYLAKLNKSYNTQEEFNKRLASWIKTETFITEWNENHISKHTEWQPTMQHTHTVAHNKFSDWHEHEMKTLLVNVSHGEGDNIKNKSKKHAHNSKNDSQYNQWSNHHGIEPPKESEIPNLPASVDWVKLNKLSPIQDQGNCGAGWAFTAVAAVESAIAIKSFENSTSAVPKLSEQQVLDCSLSHKTNGCGHGWYYYAWDYMVENALVSLEDYPYTAHITGQHYEC